MASRLLKRDEVAETLGVSTRTVDREIASGHLQTVRLGCKCVRIDSHEVEKYIAQGGRREEDR